MTSAYSDILNIMRNEGKKDNTPALQLGEMQGLNSCKVGELLLSDDDLLIAGHLITGYYYAIDENNPSLKDKSTFIEPLKAGDLVAVCKISEEKYVILERLVEI